MTFAIQRRPNCTQPLKFGAKYNALIVDDDRSIRRTVERALQRAGTVRGDEFTITQAVNLDDAKAKLQENQETHHSPFDLLITDNSMPSSGQGLALLEFISTLGAQKPAHAFMLSSDDIAPQAMARGAEGFFNKCNIFLDVETMLNRAFGPGPAVATASAVTEAPPTTVPETAGRTSSIEAAAERSSTAIAPEGAATSAHLPETATRPRTGSFSSPGLVRRAISTPDLSDMAEAFALTRVGDRTSSTGESTTTGIGANRKPFS